MQTPTPHFCPLWLILIVFDRRGFDAQGIDLGLVAVANFFDVCWELLEIVNV